MESKADDHNMAFPYLRMDGKDQKYWSDSLESSFLAEDVIRMYGGNCPYMNELCMALRILEQQLNYNPKKSYFVDCVSNCGIGSFIAFCYHYPRALSIEVSKATLSAAMKSWDTLKKEPEFTNKKMKFVEGSMQDYFPVDASVYFLNATELSLNGGVDETLLVYLFFKLCQKILSGSYLIVFTYTLQLDDRSCQEMNLTDLHCVHHVPPKEEEDYSYDLGPHFHIWILQKVPIVANAISKRKELK